jgi:hypothetical protein
VIALTYSSCPQKGTKKLLATTRTAKVLARPRWPVAYKAARSEPKAISFTA